MIGWKIRYSYMSIFLFLLLIDYKMEVFGDGFGFFLTLVFLYKFLKIFFVNTKLKYIKM